MKKIQIVVSGVIACLVLAGAGLAVYLNPVSSSDSDSSSSGSSSVRRNESSDPNRNSDYWTEERMRNAKPEHMPTVD
ncbi:hypothetical protein [Bifidobacterium sp. ESL0745]|uniref:hypothetical protein n=1 Tax=Bifidobacterium sp. ESL0745 TaxID=2983226 RepID=UPI0023F6D369|nr:hypothetical protein [Bifidobacterium sp. ESL0745]MDF7665962.1 hypothetical protein [Bifidobacterium sp. ESL0745]